MKETTNSKRLRSQSLLAAMAATLSAFAAAGGALAETPPKPASAAPAPAKQDPKAPPASSGVTEPAAPPASGSTSLGDSLTGSAKAAYDLGRGLYRAGDFAGALLQFERAYDLSSEPRLLWNVAVCEKNLRRYARSVKSIERYQAEGGTRLSEEDQKDAVHLLKAMRPFVAVMAIKVSEPGADVFIDDERVGSTPLAGPLLIDMGARRIRVSKKGFHEHTQTEQVFGESEITLDVALKKEIHQGRLIIAAGKDDVIRLDGKVVGQGSWDGTAPSGGHTLRVTAPGMKPYQTEVIVQDNVVRRIHVTLDPEPKSGVPTWALISWSAFLAVSAGIGIGYLAVRASEAPEPVIGNLGPYVVKLQ
jgi:hypothetical protein